MKYFSAILGSPWFEMGGKVSIDCAKTGYSAIIEFLTKVNHFLFNIIDQCKFSAILQWKKTSNRWIFIQSR